MTSYKTEKNAALNTSPKLQSNDSPLSPIEKLKRRPIVKIKTRKVSIKNAQAVECTSRNNEDYVAVQIDYRYGDLKVPQWRTKKAHVDFDEGQLLLDAYPFDEEALYEVETKLTKEGFWRWTSITKLEKGSL